MIAGVSPCIIRARHRQPSPLPGPPQGAQSWPGEASLLLPQLTRSVSVSSLGTDLLISHSTFV